jgi:hypothetical protein
VVLNRRLSLCFPASLETNQREHPELALVSIWIAFQRGAGRGRRCGIA